MLAFPQARFLGSLLPPHQAAVLTFPFPTVQVPKQSCLSKPKVALQLFAKRNRGSRDSESPVDVQLGIRDEGEQEGNKESGTSGGSGGPNYEEEDGGDGDGFGFGESGYRGKEEERQYDRDPELAEILGSCLNDPQKAQSKIEERLRKKRNKVLQSKTGSSIPMKVTFNKFDFSNSYIWFEFYNAPLEKDVSLICDTIRSWHIIGRLGGCNSMNMQLSQSTFGKRPNYDYIQGANVTPTTFYNIGDFEIQDNLARIWVDIGTSEPLLLDVLVNALTQISSDFVGIKQLVFGGSEFGNWKESLTSEDAGYSVRKI